MAPASRTETLGGWGEGQHGNARRYIWVQKKEEISSKVSFLKENAAHEGMGSLYKGYPCSVVGGIGGR